MTTYREDILEKLENLNYEILHDEDGCMRILIEYTERPLPNPLYETLD